jgi:GGDEF domain-containing protein
MNSLDLLTALETRLACHQALLSMPPDTELVLFDIDFLKLFMHDYGIEPADNLIIAIAHTIKQTAETLGFKTYRIHGDEFLVLASTGSGLRIAREAQLAVTQLPSKYAPVHASLGQAASVSVLVGLLGEQSPSSASDVIESLRLAMERHKSESGRGKPPVFVSVPQ